MQREGLFACMALENQVKRWLITSLFPFRLGWLDWAIIELRVDPVAIAF